MATRQDLNHIGSIQLGLITRADLRGIGVTRSRRRVWERNGTLVPLGHQTFELGGAPRGDHRSVLAACLDSGGVASHRTAAWLHRLRNLARCTAGGHGDPFALGESIAAGSRALHHLASERRLHHS